MKKLILYFVLLNNIIILPSEIKYTTKEHSPLIPKYPSLTLGNITLTSEQVRSLSDQDRQDLVNIVNPSYISKCYGLSNQLIQHTDTKTLASIVEKHPALFTSLEITAKERDTLACSCTEKSHSCIFVYAAGPALSMLSLFAYGIGTFVPTCVNPMTYTIIGLLSSIPAGCCTTELGNCVHYRCCTGQTKYSVEKT